MSRRWLPLLTVLVAVTTSVVVAVAPLRQSQSCSVRTVRADIREQSAPSDCQTSRSSLLEGEGGGVLGLLAIPVVLALLGAAWPMGTPLIVVAVLLSIGVVLSGFSIGLFYLPTAITAWAAAVKARDTSDGCPAPSS